MNKKLGTSHLAAIIRRVKYQLDLNFIKISFFTGLATFVRIVAAFVSVKIVAIIIGPVGIALLGQLNNFKSIGLSFASGGINTGVVKYTAEYSKRPMYLISYISTAFRITLAASVVTGIIILFFSDHISLYILDDKQYDYVFQIFGVTIILYTINNLILSILNGLKEFKKFIIIGIISSIIGLIFSVTLVVLWGISGALIATVTYASVIFIITLILIIKLEWLKLSLLWNNFNSNVLQKLSKYSLMAFASALTVPISQLLIRSYLINQLSSQDAGMWEAMNRISGVYLMMITSVLNIYYLPRFSELKNRSEFRSEIFNAYKTIVPIVLIASLFIYFLRSYIVGLVFSAEFAKMESLFFYQLLGDCFKAVSWMLAIQMQAQAMARLFIITEVIFSLSFVGLGVLFTELYGFIGPSIAYSINYSMYFILLIFIFRKILFFTTFEKE